MSEPDQTVLVACEVSGCDQAVTCWDDENRKVCLAHCPDAQYHERSGGDPRCAEGDHDFDHDACYSCGEPSTPRCEP